MGPGLGSAAEHLVLRPGWHSKNAADTPDIKCLTAYQLKMRVVRIQGSVAFFVMSGHSKCLNPEY